MQARVAPTQIFRFGSRISTKKTCFCVSLTNTYLPFATPLPHSTPHHTLTQCNPGTQETQKPLALKRPKPCKYLYSDSYLYLPDRDHNSAVTAPATRAPPCQHPAAAAMLSIPWLQPTSDVAIEKTGTRAAADVQHAAAALRHAVRCIARAPLTRPVPAATDSSRQHRHR